MLNRISASLRAAHRNWRRIATVGVATAGVVVLSASTAYTAAQITSADIRNQTIQSHDIGADEIGPSEMREGDRASVLSPQIRDNGIRPHDLGDNFQTDATTELEGHNVVGPEKTVPAGETMTVTAECDDGRVVTGGGYSIEGRDRELATVEASAPTGFQDDGGRLEATKWEVRVVNTGAGAFTLQTFAVCADQG